MPIILADGTVWNPPSPVPQAVTPSATSGLTQAQSDLLNQANAVLANSEDVLEFAFGFDATSPIIVTPLAAGMAINYASVTIQNAFNASTTFQLGVPGNPGLVLDSTDVNCRQAGDYGTIVVYPIATATSLIITLNTTATAGDGILVVKFK